MINSERTNSKNWLRLCKRLGVDSEMLLEELDLYRLLTIAQYVVNAMEYHNINHLSQCLQEFNRAKHLAEHPYEVEFAIWFHDIIYNPRKRDNEEKSAAVAYGTAIEIDLNLESAKRISNLILATKHKEIPKNIDAKVMCDVDLSILGKSEIEFDEYERAIRKEYSFFKDEEFKKGRKHVLEKFLSRESIYLTELFRKKYEENARRNIERSLVKLRE